uniref:Uncharacterized protein n=1 Tax=Lotus japonicus TaxID=34305 RepID=I3T1U5_LOTJA|nr:unknown [Lotus japonicus]
MPKSNGTTIDIDLSGIKSQFLAGINKLRRKCLIDFKQVNVTKFKTCRFHSGRNSKSRTNTHDRRIYSNSSKTPEDSKNRKSLLHSHSSLHKENCSSTITNLASIPCCCGSILLECRLQLCQIIHICVRSDTIINRNDNLLHLSSFRVHNLSRNWNYFSSNLPEAIAAAARL